MAEVETPVWRLHDGCLDQRESESHTLGQWEAGTEARRYLPEDRPGYVAVIELFWTRHLHSDANRTAEHWEEYPEFRPQFRYDVRVAHRQSGHIVFLQTGTWEPHAGSYRATFRQHLDEAWYQVLGIGDRGLMVDLTE